MAEATARAASIRRYGEALGDPALAEEWVQTSPSSVDDVDAWIEAGRRSAPAVEAVAAAPPRPVLDKAPLPSVLDKADEERLAKAYADKLLGCDAHDAPAWVRAAAAADDAGAAAACCASALPASEGSLEKEDVERLSKAYAAKILGCDAHDAPAWVRAAAAAADDAAAAAASDASTDDAAEEPRPPRPAPPKRRRTRRAASDAPRRDVRLARDFVLDGRCGRGAFSDVWTATSTVDGERYAIKVARRPFRSRRAREAALAECEALRALRGAPNVIAFHLAWQEGGHLHAQLELCALGSVAQIVSRNGDAPEAPHLWKLPGAARKGSADSTSRRSPRACRVSRAGLATSATHSRTSTRAVTSTATSSRATSSSMRRGS